MIKSCWILCTIAISFFACSRVEKEEILKPNIVIIMADDLGYGDLESYGSKISTPYTSKIAKEGMMFLDAHSPSSVCSPSRYGLLTGTYSWRTWLKNWIVKEEMPLLIDDHTLTIQKHLQMQGYTTGCIGKWHLGWGIDRGIDWNGSLSPGPLETGFDYYYGVPYSHNSPDYLQVFVENNRIQGLNPGEDIHDTTVLKRVQRSLENTGINLTEKAISFVIQNRDKPFFLYFPTTEVHAPVTPNERFSSNYGAYGAYVKEFDWIVGQIDSTLTEFGLKENTILIVTSDNGALNRRSESGHTPNGELRGEKGEIYEGGHRVPFIIRWPDKIAANNSSSALITLSDVFRTISGLIKSPISEEQAIDSYDFSMLLLGDSSRDFSREPAVLHSVAGMYAVRSEEWKYVDGLGAGFPKDWPKTNASAEGKPIRDLKTGEFQDVWYYFPSFPVPAEGEPSGQLYNITMDPAEVNDRYMEYPEVVSDLIGKLKNQKLKNQ